MADSLSVPQEDGLSSHFCHDNPTESMMGYPQSSPQSAHGQVRALQAWHLDISPHGNPRMQSDGEKKNRKKEINT